MYKVLIILTYATCIYSTSSKAVFDESNYVVSNVDGIQYKIMYKALPWKEAKEVCAEEGAKLAVPKTEDQFMFLRELVRRMPYSSITGTDYKLLVWLGIDNKDDYRVWRNIDGEDIAETGFSTWAKHNGNGFSDDPAEPHCVGMDAHNPGLRQYWCHLSQPYICEKV